MNKSLKQFGYEYRKGELHCNADTLSRSQCDTCVQCQTIHEEPKKRKIENEIASFDARGRRTHLAEKFS